MTIIDALKVSNIVRRIVGLLKQTPAIVREFNKYIED